MKKTVLFAALLLVSFGARTQDTLTSLNPKANCYYSYWLDSGAITDWGTIIHADYGVLVAVYFQTEDSLPVYGIAAALKVDYSEVIDTNMEESYEYLGLYHPASDGLHRIGDSLYVNPTYSPIAYYYHNTNPALASPSSGTTALNDYLAVYECYYKDPIYVKDSFYVGITERTWNRVYIDYGPDSGTYRYSYPTVWVGCYTSQNSLSPYKFLYINKDRDDGSISYLYYDNDHPGLPQIRYPYIFPILTSPDTTHTDTIIGGDTTNVDTTHIDTTHVDTVGISMRLLERYTGLQPNPAAERVLVTSSFGLQGIELYNAAGIKVYEQQATGYSAVLDVHTLPAGPYLARITTPRGTVTKKLIVQRR